MKKPGDIPRIPGVAARIPRLQLHTLCYYIYIFFFNLWKKPGLFITYSRRCPVCAKRLSANKRAFWMPRLSICNLPQRSSEHCVCELSFFLLHKDQGRSIKSLKGCWFSSWDSSRAVAPFSINFTRRDPRNPPSSLENVEVIELMKTGKSDHAWRDKTSWDVIGISFPQPTTVPLDHILFDRSRNIGPLISCWELDKLKNCLNKSFRTSKILTLLYQQFSNLLISQRDMNGPRLGALSNNRWSGVY